MSADTDSKFNPEPKTETEEEDMNYKQKLDQAAHDARHPNSEPVTKQNPIVEKVTQYIPAAAEFLGKQEEQPKQTKTDISGPPERPDHDVNIEEFVRDQHRSKGEDGVLQ